MSSTEAIHTDSQRPHQGSCSGLTCLKSELQEGLDVLPFCFGWLLMQLGLIVISAATYWSSLCSSGE